MYRGFGVKGVQNSNPEGMEATSNQMTATETTGNQPKLPETTGNDRKLTSTVVFSRKLVAPGRITGGSRRSRSHSLMTPDGRGRRIIITNYASLRVCRAARDSEANGNGQESAAGGGAPGLGWRLHTSTPLLDMFLGSSCVVRSVGRFGRIGEHNLHNVSRIWFQRCPKSKF